MFSFATKFSPEAANFEKAIFSGYQHAELHLTPTRLMSWRSLSKIARSYDMNYVLHFPTSGKVSQQTCEEIVALAQDIDCHTVTVHECDLDVALPIRKIDPGIQLAVENQRVRFDDLDSWLTANEGVTLNIEYLWENTLESCEFHELKSVLTRLFHNYGTKIRKVHLSGYRPETPAKHPLSASKEVTEFVFDLLLNGGYQGFVVGEIDVDFQTSEMLTQDLEFFRSWKNQKGLCNLSGDFAGSSNPIPESF